MYKATLHDPCHGTEIATCPTPEEAVETAYRKLALGWMSQEAIDREWPKGTPLFDGGIDGIHVWQDGRGTRVLAGTVEWVGLYGVMSLYDASDPRPCKPSSYAIQLPDDEVERDELLIRTFKNCCDHNDDVVVTPTNEFGDLRISSTHAANDIHMLITFTKVEK